MLWNISDEAERPKGKRIRLYLSLGVAKLVSLLDAKARTQCRCPDLRSTVVNTLAFESSGSMSSSTGS